MFWRCSMLSENAHKCLSYLYTNPETLIFLVRYQTYVKDLSIDIQQNADVSLSSECIHLKQVGCSCSGSTGAFPWERCLLSAHSHFGNATGFISVGNALHRLHLIRKNLWTIFITCIINSECWNLRDHEDVTWRDSIILDIRDSSRELWLEREVLSFCKQNNARELDALGIYFT